ncbi:helix-turn-helix transcriptional regulator [Olsenella profusa]|uniref:DNA-binding helix-turn-helix protein n=1 Tax=Olsenella profusa F0195 TaxID=1125712 RepID=U2TPI7_9ACTN|nr:helix-turn-helix transcriptional regulator [Olsenella profusa]ERL08038.1 DNA-binding helix-turn-helix protein [Olsenella profusa F0195]
MELKDARKAARYSQESVAGFLGISRPTYQKMEKDPGIVTVDDARKLAKLFNVKVSDIFFYENYR